MIPPCAPAGISTGNRKGSGHPTPRRHQMPTGIRR